MNKYKLLQEGRLIKQIPGLGFESIIPEMMLRNSFQPHKTDSC